MSDTFNPQPLTPDQLAQAAAQAEQQAAAQELSAWIGYVTAKAAREAAAAEFRRLFDLAALNVNRAEDGKAPAGVPVGAGKWP